MQIRQALAHDEAPALRQKFPQQKSQQLRQAREDAGRGAETSGNVNSVEPTLRLRDGEAGEARGDEKIDAPGGEIAPPWRGALVDRRAECEQRGDTTEAQQRRKGKENANAESHCHTAEKR